MKFTYLLIDVFSILIPLIFSFHPKLGFRHKWAALLIAIATTAVFFVVWDAYFTSIKIWGFNPQYLTGFYVGNLPVEELLFFVCIPYSCLFTYHCIGGLFKIPKSKAIIRATTALFILASLLMDFIYRDRLYTVFTFSLLVLLLLIAVFALKVVWVPNFFYSYLVLLVPFFIVNGLLTGTGLAQPIVWYNNSQNTGLRILTIPFEDFFYGGDLILMNLLIYSRFNLNKISMNA